MIDRRTLLRGSAAACASSLAAPFIAGRAYANPYARFKGTTLVVNFPAHPHFDAVAAVLPDFTRETGIKVEVDKLQYLRMHDKQVLEMAKPGTGDYDLLAYVAFWKSEYDSRKFLVDLGPLMKDERLALPDYDFADLVPGYVENIGLVGGRKGYLAGPGARLVGLPCGAETSALAYRKDILAKHGIAPPTTYTELSAAIDRLAAAEPGMGAMTSRGQTGSHVVHAWLLHLDPLGGTIFDEAWRPVFTSAPGIEAATFLKKVIDTGPRGGQSFGFDEMKNAFLQGRAALYLDTIVIAGEAEDPARSKVAGQVGWALHPAGIRRASQTGGFGLGIPRNAGNKEAAFLLMQWLTTKAVDRRIAAAGGSPSRASTYRDPDLQKRFPAYAVFAEALRYADPDWRPIIPEWGELNAPLFGVALGEVVTGKKSPSQALTEIVPRVEQVMTRAGYIKS